VRFGREGFSPPNTDQNAPWLPTVGQTFGKNVWEKPHSLEVQLKIQRERLRIR